jgi:hypothetical protein
MMVTTGSEAALRAWPRSTLRGRQALGEGGAHEVFSEHPQHARSRHARDERHVDQGEGGGGENQVTQELPRPVGEGLIALDGEGAQANGKNPHEEEAEPEHGHGEAGHREDHDRAIDPGALTPRREHTQGHGEEHGNQHGENGQRDRRTHPLADQGGHGEPRVDRRAQVASQHIAEPDARLGQERLVEPQPRADPGDVLRGGVVAGNDLGGIAGREVEKSEDGQGHHSHDRNGGHDPLQDQGEQIQTAEKDRGTFLVASVSQQHPYTWIFQRMVAPNFEHALHVLAEGCWER